MAKVAPSAKSLANLKPFAEVRKCERCGRMAKKTSRWCHWHQPTAPLLGTIGQDETGRYDVRATLAAIASDPHSAAHARTQALRTIAELDGFLGKHQQAPDRTADEMLSVLSREDLAAELIRLRAACAPDKARDKP